MRSRDDLLETFQIESSRADEALASDYNVAPMKTTPAVLARAPRDVEDNAAEPVPQFAENGALTELR